MHAYRQSRVYLKNRHFQILFKQALMDYWHSPLNLFDVPSTFDGRKKNNATNQCPL